MKKLLLCLVFSSGLPLPGQGLNNAPSRPAREEKIQITSDKPKKGLETLVNIDADDAFLPKILNILAEISGYNVVSGPEVNDRHRISIHLKNTPIEEAVNLVVRAAGLSYEIVGNSFLVTGQKNLEQPVGISSYYVELDYAKADEVKNLLKDLSPSVQVAPGRNALVISTSPKIIGEIRRVVEKIDQPSRQIMLQTRLIEVSTDALKEVGIDWEKLSHLTTIIAENPSDALTGARVPGVNELGTMDLGKLPGQHVYEEIDGLKNVGKFSRQLEAFDITIDWLLKTNRGRLLTDTKLTTMNNRKASLHIGEIVPFLVQSQQFAQVERESVGIKIEITPQINNDGVITATIKPEISSIIELIDGRIPRRKIRTAETTVLVRDGQKIFIAGLTSQDEKVIIHKLPFLGDLIFLGKLFQHQEKSLIKQDLIVEITPFILNNREEFSAGDGDSLFNVKDSMASLEEKFKKESLVEAPTRMIYSPTPRVLKPFQYTVGLNEVSFGQYGGIQLTVSPLRNYGKQIFGLKFKMAGSLALGAGYSRGNYWGEDKYNMGGRLGLYLVKGFVDLPFFKLNGLLDLELGRYQSAGFGLNASLDAGRWVSLMGEFTDGYTAEDPAGLEQFDPWFNTAVRFRWPGLPGLSIDAGVSLHSESPVRVQVFNTPQVDYGSYFTGFRKALYFDLAYSGLF